MNPKVHRKREYSASLQTRRQPIRSNFVNAHLGPNPEFGFRINALGVCVLISSKRGLIRKLFVIFQVLNCKLTHVNVNETRTNWNIDREMKSKTAYNRERVLEAGGH